MLLLCRFLGLFEISVDLWHCHSELDYLACRLLGFLRDALVGVLACHLCSFIRWVLAHDYGHRVASHIHTNLTRLLLKLLLCHRIGLLYPLLALECLHSDLCSLDLKHSDHFHGLRSRGWWLYSVVVCVVISAAAALIEVFWKLSVGWLLLLLFVL